MTTLPSVVTAIIVSNVILSFLGFKNQTFFNKYQFQMAKIKAGEQIRMWSSGFLHVRLQSLVCQYVVLVFFCRLCGLQLGRNEVFGFIPQQSLFGKLPLVSLSQSTRQLYSSWCQWSRFWSCLQCSPIVSKYENDFDFFPNSTFPAM